MDQILSISNIRTLLLRCEKWQSVIVSLKNRISWTWFFLKSSGTERFLSPLFSNLGQCGPENSCLLLCYPKGLTVQDITLSQGSKFLSKRDLLTSFFSKANGGTKIKSSYAKNPRDIPEIKNPESWGFCKNPGDENSEIKKNKYWESKN